MGKYTFPDINVFCSFLIKLGQVYFAHYETSLMVKTVSKTSQVTWPKFQSSISGKLEKN